ncbi:A-kinase anchor protein 9 isoform X2 [Carassius gibelio]|uniref:A-kinase anchor protein 9 isoform X2 n=1 Tax=Carassius gibelio TaxID=101364 RepID=UPI0022778BE3|nr:A-kinase anchor protein 9 isoform X2 [Carassius gibelio]
MSRRRCVEFKICQTISCSAPIGRRNRPPSPAAAAGTAETMEDEERQKKLQAGKAKLAEYRQRKAQSDGQKKQKKKKKKPEADAEEQREDQTTVMSLSKTLRSGETVTHQQTYSIQPESEVSTTAEDCSSEVNGFHERTSCVIGEEDLEGFEAHMEPPSPRQDVEDELAAKSLALEELRSELEDIRFGAEGVQQLQDFEEALKQRDEIITQLTSNLQQARTEKEEVMREFLELTEQSQKLQLQFQQLQAGEIMRSSNISSTAADLLQARQQITLHQQQLDERDAQVRGHQEKTQEQLLLITQLQESLSEAERLRTQAEESFAQSLREKDSLNTEHQRLITQLQDQLLSSKQQVEEVNKHLSVKTQELDACEKELSASRQKERMSSGEILQLMKSVEELQQRCQSERLEDDWRCRMETLRDELDEMYGQQIVEMKRELRTQHTTELERIQAQHCSETEKMVQQHQSELERCKAQLFQSTGDANVLNVKLVELQQKLQETLVLREKAEQELAQTRTDKLSQAQELERLRDELQRAEIQSPEEIQHAVSDLRAQLDSAHKANGELEAKHESEITNYKIKLEMLEREKDAVLDRMAESLESELDHLRTQLLFSHEEELSRLRDDLTRENQLNAENLRDEMDTRHREALDQLRSVESERAALASERLVLLQDIARLSSANEQMCARLNELQDEIEKQRNTFSFAEKNFEVNYQELKDEYTCLVNAKLQLERRLERETEVRGHEEVDGKTLMEKHTTELMEKLETAEKEKKSLTEHLSLMEAELETLKRGRDEELGSETHLHESSSLTAAHMRSERDTAHTAAQEEQVLMGVSLMMQPQEMDGSDHDECRLQLEAQRISLSQIHTAQLELLRESLCEQTPEEMRRDDGQRAGCVSPVPAELKAESDECSERLEIERLKSYYQQQMEETQERFTAQILLLQSRLQELTGAGEVFSMPSVCPPQTRDEQRDPLQEERLRGVCGLEEPELRRLEEEISKVIVQMSVEFAQQTEETRISRQSRETSAGTQTDSREEEEDPLMKSPEEEHRPQEDEEECLRASHTLQLEQNTLLTAQIHTLTQQLLQTELELKQTERHRDQHLLPSMQSCSTQTEQTQEEEEEEEVRGQGRAVTVEPELSSDEVITERDALCLVNTRLRQALLEVLKTTAAVEETIGRHVQRILEESSEGQDTDVSPEGFLSRETKRDEELELWLKIQGAELQLQGAELPPEGEGFLMSISTRLQSAVEKLLITITETSTQLEHARITQTELMREKFRHSEEMEELQHRQEELQERLCEEERAREQLALELHTAEGVIDGYSGERLALEQQIRERSELQLHLEQELCVTASRLRELEQERLQIHHEHELLSRQQDAMREGAGPRELHLLEETEKLMAEKVEVQRQAQKESSELLQQVKHLEAELEEQVSRLQELQETHSAETTDLRQQIQALEKQLENNRKFMDEQAADREHERDVFQQEIHKLEQQLKNPTKTQTGSDRRDREVQELSAALQEKADWCSELLLSSEQLQRDVCERDEEIETLGARLRELEHTLMHRVEEVQHVSMASRADVTLEAQLQTEREALDRKEKELVNLEEQLEQFREELENKSEEVNQLHMQLEIQRKEISVHQQDQARLAQVLEEKDRQIAVLNEQLVKSPHTGTDPEKEAEEEKDELLREMEAQVECLRSEQERLKRDSEEEVEQLNAVIEKLQQELTHIELKQRQDESEEMKQRMEESLREKSAALVVLQAQVQALEESAGSQVTSLSQRVEELETSLEQKDSELHTCRLKVEQAQTDADALYAKVTQLEEKLREKVAAVLVCQAQLEAIQTQTKELRAEAHAGEAMGPSTQQRSEGLTAQDGASTGKTSLLTEKLTELEEGLSGMQKDQELQKQLLSSSEEEVMEYERRLAVMIDLLNHMRSRPSHHRLVSGEASQSLSEQLQEVKGQAASTQEELSCYRELSHKLQEEMEMKESMITQLQTALNQVSASTRDEDAAQLLQELQEVRGQASSRLQELESSRDQSVRLQELLQEREMSIALLKDQLHRASQEGDRSTAELLQELQEVKGQAAATKEQLRSFQERSLKLQEEIEVRDASIAELKDTVHELQTALARSSEEPAQPRQKGDVREPPGMDRSTRKEQQELMLGYEEKIAQMQELHAAEILDMESRHISESESLRRESQRLEDECGALRDAIHTLQRSQAPSVRSERPDVSPIKDGYTSDSGSDWSQRAGYDPHRSTPEGARRDTDTELLPDTIKSLLREVHQEGMQVLSLTELPLTEADPPPQSRERENTGLINTIQSLQLLISTLHTHTQLDVDWRAELLSAVQQVFVQERDVLKNLLYSHLERLDTADAVTHLTQLERALAEQDARHRGLMGALSDADRNSLRSEIQQLRDQLHTLTAEQTQRHHQDRAGTQSGRLLETMRVESGSDGLEEMKTELSRTKLELENTLQSQHTHLKELHTLRAEVSLKAAEVDTLNDRLSLEQKRVRELQWAFEKEKRKSDRKQESEREEVEDLKLSVEELSRALEKERQVSARLREQELRGALEEQKEMNTQTSSTSNPHESQMMEELERHKLEALQCKRQWDEEKSTLIQDQNALRATCDVLERRARELQTELERERHRLQESHRSEDRTRDWVLQAGESLCEGQRSDPSILSRLQLIAEKIHSLTRESPDRLSGEAPDRDSLAWLHSNVQEVMSLLQRIPSAPSALPESAALLAGGSSSLLNERLLRQNAELTGFVSRLTEEKNDLRNQLLKLEEELRRYRAKKTTAESSWMGAGAERQELLVFSSERDSWTQERNRLEKCLRQAESELSRLRAENRSETLRDLTGADPDTTALRRMYGRYLRSEGFRKALIYQKKYLLLLLGGFQECEQATLSLIARMGGFPSHTRLEPESRQSRGFTRFRSAVRVCIALSRMRFLVKRWQRAAGGSVASQITSRNGLAQISDVRSDSSYLQPGALEVFRERRASSRGRTGRDSIQHRLHSVAGDGGLACSHLQNYDPDRALTDYISRLEALHRRLGSVTTGSSSYAQMFGVRR